MWNDVLRSGVIDVLRSDVLDLFITECCRCWCVLLVWGNIVLAGVPSQMFGLEC